MGQTQKIPINGKRLPSFFFHRENLHLFPFLFSFPFGRFPSKFPSRFFSPFSISHQNFLPGFFHLFQFPIKISFQEFFPSVANQYSWRLSWSLKHENKTEKPTEKHWSCIHKNFFLLFISNITSQNFFTYLLSSRKQDKHFVKSSGNNSAKLYTWNFTASFRSFT